MKRVRRSATLWLFISMSSLAARGADNVVYDDALGAWENWSWGSTIDFADTSVAQAGSSSIAVAFDGAWAGLYLHSSGQLSPQAYSSLRFWIHGGAQGGHALRVIMYDEGLNATASSFSIPAPQAGVWTQHEVPLSTFGSAVGITGFVWQDSSGGAQPVCYLDEIVLVGQDVPPVTLALSVDASADVRPISPYVYGINFADPALMAELNLPVRRWGGNATTRYNWRLDVSNRASDWYFENIPNADPGTLPIGSSSDQFVQQGNAAGADTILTLPLIGWTPKSRTKTWGFSVAKYGPQEDTDPWQSDAGNGVAVGGALITGNDPLDTSVAIDATFVTDWIAHLISQFGAAGAGGVRFYNLDNEPMLWNSTHRDVHPLGASYDETRDLTYAYGAAIKQADPDALTLGPALWGWTAYFYSAKDVTDGGDQFWNTRPDRMAHGDTPFVEWYLQQMKAYEDANSVRILDYLDLHYYPQASGVALSSAGDAATQARRLRATRSLWDPTYADESWIGEAVQFIPRVKGWIDTHYPGTKLAMTEYNFGGLGHINGALAQADVLGIFGREGMDLATLWAPPGSSEPGAFAFRVFLNYDGASGKFGETSVRAASTDQDQVSVYAALRDSDSALTVLVINKTNAGADAPLTVQDYSSSSSTVLVYRYSAADLTQIVRESDLAITAGTIDASYPAESITVLVLAGEGSPSPTPTPTATPIPNTTEAAWQVF